MKDLEFDCQVVSSVASDLAPVQDWTIDAEDLIQSLATDTAHLIEAVKKHFLKIGKARRNIFSLAEEAGESRQAQNFFKQNFKAPYRKDMEKGHRLCNYLDQLESTGAEESLTFLLSTTGFDIGNSILGKLPDTLSKPEFRGLVEDEVAKKKEVATAILGEMVDIALKEQDGEEKQGVKSSDIGRLIKLQSVPDCDRVEFKEAHVTYRAEVVEYCPDADVIKVRVDGSGEEKEIPRGTIALKEQKAPKLHEPCLVQGDEIANYNKCGIFKALLNDDKALVLLLDGSLIEVPKKSVIKGKKGSPIPELLYLLDRSGNADKVSLAVEKAVEKTKKAFEKQIGELTTEAGKAYSDGRDSIAAEAREMQPKIPFDMFLSIPVPEKLAIFAAQPDEAKNLILANYVKSLPPVEKVNPPVVEIQASAVEVIDRPAVEVKAVVVEAEAPVAEPAINMTRFINKDLTETLPIVPPPLSLEERLAEAEIEYQQALDTLRAKKQELHLDSDLDLTNHAGRKQCEAEIKVEKLAKNKLFRLRNELKALTAVVEPAPAPSVEIAFSEDDIALADKVLLRGYRAIVDGQRMNHALTEVIKGFPMAKEYLVSTHGQEWLGLYYFKGGAADTEAIVRSVILDIKEGDRVLDRAIDRTKELEKLAQFYRKGNKTALEKVSPKLKLIAQQLLSKEEVDAIKAKASGTVTVDSTVAASRTEQSPAPSGEKGHSIETIKEWLCSSLIGNGIAYLETNKIPLLDVLSQVELQAMYDGGGLKQSNAIALVDRFKCTKLINFESVFGRQPKPMTVAVTPPIKSARPTRLPESISEDFDPGF